MLVSDSPDDVAYYRKCAEDWMGALDSALLRCGLDWKDLNAVLEIGCGYGRIVRFLVQRVSPDHVYVCDVIDEAATFTAQEFAVHKVSPVGGPDFPTSESFDLVYLLVGLYASSGIRDRAHFNGLSSMGSISTASGPPSEAW
jgi:SAM-dependent methyltransferase